jgi:hypothetical protein
MDSALSRPRSSPASPLAPGVDDGSAMIVGMMPMALGGAGEEQNATLARAVIGGLVVGT